MLAAESGHSLDLVIPLLFQGVDVLQLFLPGFAGSFPVLPFLPEIRVSGDLILSEMVLSHEIVEAVFSFFLQGCKILRVAPYVQCTVWLQKVWYRCDCLQEW